MTEKTEGPRVPARSPEHDHTGETMSAGQHTARQAFRHRARCRPERYAAPARRLIGQTAAGALLLAVAATALLPAVPAAAHGDESRVVSTLRDVHPAPPEDVLLRVLTSDSEQVGVVNPTPVPLVAIAPDGSDFLRVSASGVELNEASSFALSSRVPPGADVAQPRPTDPAAAPRWVQVSQDVSWRWYDPRLHPPVAPPSGERMDTATVLATWTLPLRYGETLLEARGTVDWVPTTGRYNAEVDPPPAGVSASTFPGATPRLILQSSASAITVLGLDGEPFLRKTADGSWEGNLDSRTYRATILVESRSVPAGSGWLPHSGPGVVNWLDERLRTPQGGPPPGPAGWGSADAKRWAVPLIIDGRQVVLTGTSRETPVVSPPAPPANGTSTATPLIAGVAAAALAFGILMIHRTRRRWRDLPDASSTHLGDAAGAASRSGESVPH